MSPATRDESQVAGRGVVRMPDAGGDLAQTTQPGDRRRAGSAPSGADRACEVAGPQHLQ